MLPSHGCQHVSSLFLSDFPKLSFKHEPGSTGNIAKGAFVRAGDILNYFRAFFTGRLSPIKCTDNAGDSFHPHSGGKLSQTLRKRALAIIRTGNPCKNPAFYRGAPSERKGQNIGTLKKREQASMLLSSNYRRNSTYVANIG